MTLILTIVILVISVICFILGYAVCIYSVYKETIGTLIIVNDEEDEPYIFIELSEGPSMIQHKKRVLVNVRTRK